MPLIDRPFRAAEAVAAGALCERQLRRHYARVYPGVWAPKQADLSPRQRAYAAWLWSRRRGVPAGLSASALLGAKWIDAGTPATLIHSNRRPPPLIEVHTDTVLPGEIRQIGRLPVTSPTRTAFDLGRWLPLTAGVARIDALMNATDVKVADIAALAALHPGVPGLRKLDKTLQLVDGGAESPYESLTRLLLIQAGFPPPQTQIEVRDDYGHVVARIDLGWEDYLVGVDFEGAHHWTDPTQHQWDIERDRLLSDLDWIDIKLTSSMLHRTPRVFLDRVAGVLVGRGCPKTW